jgi:glutamyl-tRNA reductase
MQSPYIKFSTIGVSLNTVTNKQFADLKKDLEEELKSNLIAALEIKNYFFLSTCNRLELYFIEEASSISNLTNNTLLNHVVAQGYYKSGYEAIRHLARVASGMDSKILGDYEIVSQVKNATNEAVERGTFNSVLERIAGFALQVSKRVRTETKISQGITSYASAAVDILQKINRENLRVAVVGTGDIGSQVVKYLAADKKRKAWDVTVFNRTQERAKELAEAEHFSFGSFENLVESSHLFDVLINCADLQEEDVSRFSTALPCLVIDLTPQQVFEQQVQRSGNIKYYSLDQIHSTIENIKKGKQDQLLLCEGIIDACISEMHQNQKIRHYLPLLHRYGDVLHKTTKETSSDTSHYRNLVVNHVFKKTKNSSLNGCDMISVFTESRSEKKHE